MFKKEFQAVSNDFLTNNKRGNLQGVHRFDDDPTTKDQVSGSHSIQDVAAIIDDHEPSAQNSQVFNEAPIVDENLPGRQALHVLIELAPTVSDQNPAAQKLLQVEMVEAPPTADHVPALQLMHKLLLDAMTLDHVPGTHGIQSIEVDAPNKDDQVPATQF